MENSQLLPFCRQVLFWILRCRWCRCQPQQNPPDPDEPPEVAAVHGPSEHRLEHRLELPEGERVRIVEEPEPDAGVVDLALQAEDAGRNDPAVVEGQVPARQRDAPAPELDAAVP